MQPVVRNIQNSELYFYKGENIFENIITGKSGNVDDETAKRIFKVNLEVTLLINEYPNLIKLIKSLKLVFDEKNRMLL